MPEIETMCPLSISGHCIIQELREKRAKMRQREAPQEEVDGVTNRLGNITPCPICVYDQNPERPQQQQ